MLEVIGTVVFVGALVVAPLVWREWVDRREARALVVRADVQSAIARRLGGESFVSVRARPAGVWRRGRVELSTPTGWEWLIGQVWMTALDRVPENYELVVTPGRRAPAGTAGRTQLKTAA